MTIVTVDQLDLAAQTSLEFHMNKMKVKRQNEQERPLYDDLVRAKKNFPGGKDFLTERVTFEYVTTTQGVVNDSSVSYGNPAKMATAYYPWKIVHAGITVSHHELLKNGINVVDSLTGEKTTPITGRDAFALADILDYKVGDLLGGWEEDLDKTFWGDGTSDGAKMPGIRSIIVDNPAASVTVGGIDQAQQPKWRNYAHLNINTTTPSNQNIVIALQKGFRQMRKHAKAGVKHKIYAGSDFIDAYHDEIRAKGTYTDRGFMSQIDPSMPEGGKFSNQGIKYTPTLDDLGLSKYCFVLDMNSINFRVVDNNWMKMHHPARPAEKYTLYKAITAVGGITCNQRNTSGVFSIL